MNLIKIIKEHPSFRFVQDFSDMCRPLTLLGIHHFSHVRVSRNGKFSFLSQNPKFLKHYLSQKYYDFDSHQLPPQQGEQYILKNIDELSGMTKQMHQDFNDFGFGHTLTIIYQGQAFSDYYNFAASIENHEINHQYFSILNQLKQFILHFNDKVQSHKTLARAYQYSLSLDTEHGKFQTIVTEDTAKPMLLASLDRIYIPGADAYLTRREYACLGWLAKGKTQEEVAEILGISHRTVKAHIISARKKLNCVNQFQLGMLFNKIQFF